jgi:diguanylate cyclase (GGDEF)-like protein
MHMQNAGRSTRSSEALVLRDDHPLEAAAPPALGLAVDDAATTPWLLLVEDGPQDAVLYTAMLQSSALSELFDVVHVGSLEACIAEFAEGLPACILLDLGLPDAQGTEGIERIRMVAPHVPVVVLTGTDDDAVGLIAMQSGAQDYLIKGRVDSHVLTKAVRYAIERMRTEQRIHFLAFHDSLTGLANRSLFADRLEVALAHAQRRAARSDGTPGRIFAHEAGSTPAVLVLDLDHFKVVNDSLGHASGDLLLQAVANRLQAVVRPSDTVARLGGDEFAILCEGTSAAAAITVARRIIDVLSAPVALDGAEAFVRASVGIAVAPATWTDGDGLVRDADVAMYRAKAAGRGRYVIFEEDMRTAVHVRHATNSALHRALERSEFRLVYQPEIDLRSGRICGVEALLRWQEPTRGLLLPEAFLPAAEESGLIVPIGSWVLATALEQAAAWADAFPDRDPLTTAVNLSARQLVEPDIVDVVAQAMTRLHLKPGAVCLCLEVTETALLEDLALMGRRLTALKAIGLQLAVDDFGTGFSSLTHLQRLPVDIIKIDRSFIAGLAHGEKELAIIQSLVEMGRRLRLTVVAEGVETAEQLALLREVGCDIAQGFHMARPLSSIDMTALLDRDPTW